MICGIFNIGKAKQWVVTPKFARKELLLPEDLPAPDSEKYKLDDCTLEQLSPVLAPSDDSLDSRLEMADTSIYGIQINVQVRLEMASSMAWPIHKVREISEIAAAKTSSVIARLIPIASAYQRTARLLQPKLRFHKMEMIMSIFLFLCFYYAFLMRHYGTAAFCLMNALSYTVMGFGWMGRSG